MIIRFFRIILFLTLFAGVSCATRDHNDVLPSNEEANLCIVPEPKEYLQIGKKKHKLKEVNYDTKTVFTDPDEYRIVIKRGKATITGNAVWAQSTLNQLVDANGKVADCEIHDWAAYPFRGFMHDTGRNYQPVSLLKETLDLMRFYKLNYFHWHLTDHPAWRIECKAYP